MKRALVEFEIDLTKMPLGKLSKSQIQQERNILLILNTKYESQDFAPFLDIYVLITIPGSIVSIFQSQVSGQSLRCLKTVGKISSYASFRIKVTVNNCIILIVSMVGNCEGNRLKSR